jgi:hypothetical protein
VRMSEVLEAFIAFYQGFSQKAGRAHVG